MIQQIFLTIAFSALTALCLLGAAFCINLLTQLWS